MNEIEKIRKKGEFDKFVRENKFPLRSGTAFMPLEANTKQMTKEEKERLLKFIKENKQTESTVYRPLPSPDFRTPVTTTNLMTKEEKDGLKLLGKVAAFFSSVGDFFEDRFESFVRQLGRVAILAILAGAGLVIAEAFGLLAGLFEIIAKKFKH